MKNFLTRLFYLTIILCFITQSIMAVPADPDNYRIVTQPDGSQFQMKAIGDEFSGRFETSDNYTVIKSSDGFYYYAEADQNGNTVLSSTKVNSSTSRTISETEFLNSIPKNLSLSPSQLKPNNNYSVEFTPIRQTKSVTGTALTTYNILVICIRFIDTPNIYPKTDFDSLLNAPGFDTYGSMNDFYVENSYGQFGIQGDVAGWTSSENPHIYYGYNDGNNWVASAELVLEAVIGVARNIDFSKYDNDGDGEVDGLMIVHSGPGAETGYDEYPWSHRWSISSAGLSPLNYNGVLIDGYTMQPELNYGTDMVRIGVFCHEYGHALGLPDLYDTNGGSIGIGRWGLMSGGSWNGGGRSPALMCAWSKTQMGWMNPINITNLHDTVSLTDAALSDNAYRLWKDGTIGPEYFLVEYRGQGGFDAFLPGCGIAVWHIDDRMSTNADETHRIVDLEEMDNSENSSATDLWLGHVFNNDTNPDSRSYAVDTTLVTVDVLSNQCDSVMNLILRLDVAPCCVGIRGNYDSDPLDQVDISDVLYMVSYFFDFPPGPAPDCFEEGDLNNDGFIDIVDLLFMVDYAFVDPAGPAPFNCF